MLQFGRWLIGFSQCSCVLTGHVGGSSPQQTRRDKTNDPSSAEEVWKLVAELAAAKAYAQAEDRYIRAQSTSRTPPSRLDLSVPRADRRFDRSVRAELLPESEAKTRRENNENSSTSEAACPGTTSCTGTVPRRQRTTQTNCSNTNASTLEDAPAREAARTAEPARTAESANSAPPSECRSEHFEGKSRPPPALLLSSPKAPPLTRAQALLSSRSSSANTTVNSAAREQASSLNLAQKKWPWPSVRALRRQFEDKAAALKMTATSPSPRTDPPLTARPVAFCQTTTISAVTVRGPAAAQPRGPHHNGPMMVVTRRGTETSSMTGGAGSVQLSSAQRLISVQGGGMLPQEQAIRGAVVAAPAAVPVLVGRSYAKTYGPWGLLVGQSPREVGRNRV